MTIRAMIFVAFMLGLLTFSYVGTRDGFGLPEAEKEAINVREGSAKARGSHSRAGRFWFFRSGK